MRFASGVAILGVGRPWLLWVLGVAAHSSMLEATHEAVVRQAGSRT